MAINATVQSVCQTVRSIGYPKKKERRLEARIRTIYRSQGLPGIVERFKHLQQSRAMSFDGHPKSDWIRMTRSRQQPKNAIEREVWHLSDAKFYRVTGAVIMSVQRDINGKDINDWYDTASADPVFAFDISDDASLRKLADEGVRRLIAVSHHTSDPSGFRMRAAKTINSNSHIWDMVSQKLYHDMVTTSRLPFSPSDVTKTAVPLGAVVHHVVSTRQKDGSYKVDQDDLLRSYRLSQYTAPDFMSSQYQLNQELYQVSIMLQDEDPVAMTLGLDEYEWFNGTGSALPTKQLRKYEYSRQEYNLSYPGHIEATGTKFGLPYQDLSKYGGNNFVGSISFLSKPGLKARVVANPNRRVQREIVPLGESIQECVYNHPRYFNHTYVMNQDAGRAAVSNRLMENKPTASVDLHSATDTIDFGMSLVATGYTVWHNRYRESIERGYSLLKNSHLLFRNYAETKRAQYLDRSSAIREQGTYFVKDYPRTHEEQNLFKFHDKDLSPYRGVGERDIARAMLDAKMRLFDQVRQGRWSLDTNVPFPVDSFSFRRGQPLGTRPSFPLLTWTNNTAARLAGAKWWAVVGDDIIMDADHYRPYAQLMKGLFKSPINEDKTLISSQHAEFVGYMFDGNGRIYPKKPRFSASVISNAVRFGTKSSAIRDALAEASKGMIPGLDSISDIPRAELPLAQRISTTDAKLAEKLMAKAVADIVDDSVRRVSHIEESGDQLAAHVSSVLSTNDTVDPPERHVGNMTYSQNLSFFNHHSMKQELVRESLWQSMRKHRLVARLAEDLNHTGTAVCQYAVRGKAAYLLFDLKGRGVLFIGDKAVDVKLTSKQYRKIYNHPGHLVYGTADRVHFQNKLGILAKEESIPSMDPVEPNETRSISSASDQEDSSTEGPTI